jgi:hypothetical protein
VTGDQIFKWPEIEPEIEVIGTPDDYVVQEVGRENGQDGQSGQEDQEKQTIVKNEKAGLTVTVPNGWTTEKMDVEQGSMVFYSPDAEGVRLGTIRPPLKKGCLIEVALAYQAKTIEEIRKESEESHKFFSLEFDIFEVINVDNIPALKNTFNSIALGYAIEAYIPVEEKIIGLGLSIGSEDIERCSQEFDKLLKAISIQ